MEVATIFNQRFTLIKSKKYRTTVQIRHTYITIKNGGGDRI